MSDDETIAAQVGAAAALLAVPLDNERRSAVIALMTRLAAFARDVAGVPLDEHDGD